MLCGPSGERTVMNIDLPEASQVEPQIFASPMPGGAHCEVGHAVTVQIAHVCQRTAEAVTVGKFAGEVARGGGGGRRQGRILRP